MEPLFSFDLDSTLADTRHRKGIVEKYKAQGKEVDWDEYAQACLDDAPTGLVAVLKVIQDAFPWIAVSGRSEGARKGTEEWLERHGLKPVKVFLEGEGRSQMHSDMGHTDFKTFLVMEAAAWATTSHYQIVAHFDDWPTVAAAIEEASGGRIKGVTLTPPGMVASFPAIPDNPGEKVEEEGNPL